jgi:hypothetical protein
MRDFALESGREVRIKLPVERLRLFPGHLS